MDSVLAISMSSITSSNGTLFVSIVIFALIAMFGYRISERSRLLRGVTPWRIPSIVWAIICFMFSIFGIVLECIALLSTRPALGKMPPLPPRQAPYVPMADVATSATSAVPVADYVPAVPASGFAPPPADASGRSAPFGWYADVTGRHEQRYFDGRDWTKYVNDAGTPAEDPIV